ncbi:hypothetical protein V5O48_017650 [Marasmius crinis-equi]|uniref:Uncharacterized protein n=1 Tax=Marasmius crinis-equi TaxID=585013 RepID=A0ABR3ENJ7_9AGAR
MISELLRDNTRLTESVTDLADFLALFERIEEECDNEEQENESSEDARKKRYESKVRALLGQVAVVEQSEATKSDGDLKEKFEALNKKYSDSQEAIKKRDDALRLHLSDIEKLAQRVDQLLGDKKAMDDQLGGMSVEVILETIEEFKLRIEELEADRLEPQGEKPQSTSELKVLHEKQIEALHKTIKLSKDTRDADARAHKAELDKMNTEYQKKLEEQARKKDAIKAQLDNELKDAKEDSERKATLLREFEETEITNARILGDMTVEAAVGGLVDSREALRKAQEDAIELRAHSRQARVQELETTVTDNAALMEEQKRNLEALQRQLSSANANERNAAEMARARGRIGELEKDKENLEKGHQKLADKWEHDKNRLTDLENALTDKKTEVEALKGEVLKAQADVTKHKTDSESLEIRKQALEIAALNNAALIEEKDRNLESLRERLESANCNASDLAQARDRIGELEKDKENMVNDHQKLTEDRERDKKRLTELENAELAIAAALEGKTNVGAVTKQRCQGELRAVQSRLNDREMVIADITSTIATQRAKIEDWERERNRQAAALGQKTLDTYMNDVRISERQTAVALQAANATAQNEKVLSLDFRLIFQYFVTQSAESIQVSKRYLRELKGMDHIPRKRQRSDLRSEKTKYQNEIESRCTAEAGKKQVDMDLKIAQNGKAILEKQVADLQDNLDKKAREYATAAEQSSKQVETLETRLADLEGKRNDDVTRLNRQNKQAKVALEATKTELAESKKRLEGALEAAKTELVESKKRSEEALEAVKTELAASKERLEEAGKTISRLKGKTPAGPLATSNEEVEGLRRELEEAKRNLETAKSSQSTGDPSADVEKLRLELQAAKQELEKLQKTPNAVEGILRSAVHLGRHLRKKATTLDKEVARFESTRPSYGLGEEIEVNDPIVVKTSRPWLQQGGSRFTLPQTNEPDYDADAEDNDVTLNQGGESDDSQTYKIYTSMFQTDRKRDNPRIYKNRLNALFRKVSQEALGASAALELFLAEPVSQKRLEDFELDEQKYGPKIHNTYLFKAGTTTEELRKSTWNQALELRLAVLCSDIQASCSDKGFLGPPIDWKKMAHERLNAVYEAVIETLPTTAEEKNDTSLIVERLTRKRLQKNIKNGQVGFRNAKFHGRLEISRKMVRYSKERKDEQGVRFWTYAYEVTEALGCDGMSDEEAGEMEANPGSGVPLDVPVNYILVLSWQHPLITELYMVFDRAPELEPLIIKQTGKRQRIRSAKLSTRNPPRKLSRSLFAEEYLSKARTYELDRLSLSDKVLPLRPVLVQEAELTRFAAPS